MALIAALLPDPADRDALAAAASNHQVQWADDWKDLSRVVRKEPVVAAIADLHAERGKDGALRIYRFSKRYPHTPVLVWGDLGGRDLFRLGKAGATDVVVGTDARNRSLVADLLGDATRDRIADRLDARFVHRVGPQARQLIGIAAAGIASGMQVPEMAENMGVSVSTLERRCLAWGLTTPGRVLLWLRIVYGLAWLLEPGRSVESVAGQLGYSSGAAFRRAIKVTVGGRPTPLRNPAGVTTAIDGFVADCPGDPEIMTQVH